METSVEVISPERADALLRTSPGNRNIVKSWVNSLAGIIKRGEWMTTHQGIAIDTLGRLRDGHHRMEAIKKAGVPVTVAITYGVSPDSFAVMDCGRARTLSDRMGVDRRITEPVRFALALIHKQNKPTAQQATEMYSVIGSAVEMIVDYCGTSRRNYSAASVKLAAAIAILDGEDKLFVLDQYRALVLLNFDEMTTAAKSLVRQTESGVTSPNKQRDFFARALKVFDQSRSATTKIYADPDAAIEYATKVLNRQQLQKAA